MCEKFTFSLIRLITLVLVLITNAIVALVRQKIIGARNSPSSQFELITSQKQEMDYSPDLIPKDSGNYLSVRKKK